MKLILMLSVLMFTAVQAEYGDVILNRYAEKEDMRPVVFPHWFHRIRFRCKVCHADLGFKFQAENCDLCHSGRPGLKSRIIGGHQTGGPGRW